ncbi:DNA-binding protein [Stenotrophomonas pictorum JCM 9942]|uniref:DNA-binding protein n=2 Tax=Stenotrophomonas pictorum TaxID=86184 RepID=A0A0R0AMU1_9GAMM|nr:DNA-processing protein DprA [Stenotrophomonas pictorum]KRG42337.1 DNA-binding protein [Stenotrophomonas pictorum JCM 9942]
MSSVFDQSLFAAPPIELRREMAAYESLWLQQGAWFKGVAQLFADNPNRVPSELVPAATVRDTWKRLLEEVGQERLKSVGVRVHGAGEYPAKLREADHPIELLYYRGNWELVDTRGVAVVGTRNPTPEGAANATRIAHALVRRGFTVVSGLARGIDSAAHRGALEAGGRTIAVIGTPLFDYYPRENADLQEKLAKEHLVISQVPFLRYKQQHYKANSLFFPARNVTMSALTEATVIVEAGNTSGTLVQARAALAQGRKLFILDSCFRNPSLSWPRKYEEQGAIRVRNITEIMEALGKHAPTED